MELGNFTILDVQRRQRNGLKNGLLHVQIIESFAVLVAVTLVVAQSPPAWSPLNVNWTLRRYGHKTLDGIAVFYALIRSA